MSTLSPQIAVVDDTQKEASENIDYPDDYSVDNKVQDLKKESHEEIKKLHTIATKTEGSELQIAEERP